MKRLLFEGERKVSGFAERPSEVGLSKREKI